ncbi:MAG: DUF389 domain-containing protein [Bdellovibrionaceae bacterium]|nr:DUF389 domain-containing protein [Pseudobdellovibrionaceae bacterium]
MKSAPVNPLEVEGGFWGALDRTLTRLRELLHLRADTDEAGTIETIRRNATFHSANAWTLACAILIACIGLDTNNTMAVFGAMLISPLMGPVVGVGLGLGIEDSALLKRAIRNLLFAVGIALTVSLLYFLISPLAIARSEILSYTRPTFFDVLVAIFGGATGIVAQSRRSKGTSIAGVAMATVMMPPLCTTGFALATLQPELALGAFYLFLINSVFICLSTFTFVRYLKFERIGSPDQELRRLTRKRMAILALIVMTPSLVLAWRLQQETQFIGRAREFVNKDIRFAHSFVVDHEIVYHWYRPRISVTLIGEPLLAAETETLRARLVARGLPATALELHETELDTTLERQLQDRLRSRDAAERIRETRISQLESRLSREEERRSLGEKISAEMKNFFPEVSKVILHEDATQGIWVIWEKSPASAARVGLESYARARSGWTDAPIQHAEHTP